MRPLISVLAVLGVAWLIHSFLQVPEPEFDPEDPIGTIQQTPSDDGARPTANHATLVVHVVAPDGEELHNADIGTENGGAIRWVPALGGKRVFTDMPPGTVRIHGRAPERIATKQARDLSPGMRTEVRLVLRKR